MPIYEFVCNACKSPVSVFVRSMSSELNPTCDKCGSTDLARQISQVSIPKFGGAGSEGFDMNDPEMAAMMQQMGGMGGMGGMGMGGMGGFGGMDDFGDDDF